MRNIASAFILALFAWFSSGAYAYPACAPYNSYTNPNPTLPCSYNGYDYNSLAVEAGVNSFFYRGTNYSLTDHDWWWALESGPYQTCDGLMVAWGSYNCSYNLSFNKSGALFFGVGPSYTDTLTIMVNPTGSGEVSKGSTACTSYPCQFAIAPNTNVSVTATANSGYAFGYWSDGSTNQTSNPLTFTMNGGKALTAKSFKTFRASAGSFRANVNTSGGQCVPYVRDETDIPPGNFSGNAASTYQQAIDTGYATGATPRVSSIIVFAAQGNMTVGHVGIVTAINGTNLTIRDSNWSTNNDEVVREHTVDVSQYTILGYIYYTP